MFIKLNKDCIILFHQSYIHMLVKLLDSNGVGFNAKKPSDTAIIRQ